MAKTATLHFNRRPSTLAFMLRALYPSPGLRNDTLSLAARWRNHRVDPGHLEQFLRLTGLAAEHGLPILYPHVFGFPLLMALLTHPRYPFPIWGALQIRNRLQQRRPLAADRPFDLEARLTAHRVLDKGVEIDVRTTAHDAEGLAWESLNTFYYRGRFGPPSAPSPLAAAPTVGEAESARWRTDADTGWPFARFSGDYNGIHLWDWYARRLGFRRAFHHPQLVLGQCLAHLPQPRPEAVQRLDTWLKGPVFYRSEVALRIAPEAEGTAFALMVGNSDKPAIVGRYGIVSGTD